MKTKKSFKNLIAQIAPEHSRRRKFIKRARFVCQGLQAPQSKDGAFDALHKKLLAAAPEDLVIFDIGAHAGESVKRFKVLFPKARVFAFEPDPDNFVKLQNNTKDLSGVRLFNFGLGARNEQLQFYRNIKSNTSSLNPVNPDSQWARTRSENYGITVAEFTHDVTKVEIRSLDSVMAELGLSHVHLVKMDTQGHEDEVLRGAQNALQGGAIDVIETELILGNPYQKHLRFADIENLIHPHGFDFVAISNAGNLIDTPGLSVDLIYAKRGIAI